MVTELVAAKFIRRGDLVLVKGRSEDEGNFCKECSVIATERFETFVRDEKGKVQFELVEGFSQPVELLNVVLVVQDVDEEPVRLYYKGEDVVATLQTSRKTWSY